VIFYCGVRAPPLARAGVVVVPELSEGSPSSCLLSSHLVGFSKSASIITRGRRSLGYGFVELSTLAEANAAVAKFNGTQLVRALSRSLLFAVRLTVSFLARARA